MKWTTSLFNECPEYPFRVINGNVGLTIKTSFLAFCSPKVAFGFDRHKYYFSTYQFE